MEEIWFKEGGFQFISTDYDYDYIRAKSIWYKSTKHLLEKAWAFKYDNERDYDRCEYDCTGSTEVRIKIQRRGNHFRIILNESKDVWDDSPLTDFIWCGMTCKAGCPTPITT